MFSTQNEPQAEEICYNIFMLDFERLADEYRILSYLVRWLTGFCHVPIP